MIMGVPERECVRLRWKRMSDSRNEGTPSSKQGSLRFHGTSSEYLLSIFQIDYHSENQPFHAKEIVSFVMTS